MPIRGIYRLAGPVAASTVVVVDPSRRALGELEELPRDEQSRRTVDNRLVWEELRSYSTRRRAASPTSGLVGRVVLEAEDWSPFWPWLVWGQFVHVGKDAVKGGGWMRVSE